MSSSRLILPLAALAGLLALPASADAQFGVVVPPPAGPPPAALTDSAGRPLPPADSVERAAQLEVRAWVDSAAAALAVGSDTATGVTPQPVDTTLGVAQRPPSDSTIRVDAPPPLDRRTAPRDTGVRGAIPVPDTGSPLPLLALVGAGLAAAGAALRRR